MANNFRLTGNVYVSKAGSDSNSGLTPELPKLTVQAALNILTNNQTLIIGSGVYYENISKFFSSATNISIIGDGIVKLNGNSFSNNFIINSTTAVSSLKIINILLENYDNIDLYLSNTSPSFFGYSFKKCSYFYIGNYTLTGGTNGITTFDNCILINSEIRSKLFSANNLNIAFGTFNKSIFIGVTYNYSTGLIGLSTITSCYLDSKSIITLSSSAVNNFNNIEGKIVMFTNGAVSGANSNGVAQSFAQHRIDYPTYNVNSISANPLFNDAQNLNFTLQSSSPHIRAANDFISNIGGTEYAVYMKASDAELTSGATITNLTLQANNSYVITSPSTTGSIITGAKLLQWPRTKPLTRIEWAGSLEFNKSITAGTAGNQNVPDYETSNTGAAASPDRLCVKMRFSTQQTQPATSAEWDNDGLWTAGQYRLFEINSKPKVDVNGLGNGSSAYVEFTGLGDIVPSWVQMDIVLINNYS